MIAASRLIASRFKLFKTAKPHAEDAPPLLPPARNLITRFSRSAVPFAKFFKLFERAETASVWAAIL